MTCPVTILTSNLFHNSGLDSQLTKEKRIRKKYLINVLNYINFQDETILINFKHPKYDSTMSFQAKPQPYLGSTLKCLWIGSLPHQISKSYEFLNLLVSDGQKLIYVKPDLIEIDKTSVTFSLPSFCYSISSRKLQRYPCKDIQVEFIQNGAIFYGFLLDFNPTAFHVKISIKPPQTFNWIDAEAEVYVVFKNEQEVVYSGECRIIRQDFAHKMRIFVLEPVKNQIRRFSPKELRSSRYELLPSPSAIFNHPILRKIISFQIEDLSGSGFSVSEYRDCSVLLPGMTIPKLEIEFAQDFTISCKAQVMYRKVYKTDNGEAYAKCGIGFLDMNIQDQGRLSNILHQMANKNAYVDNRVNLDALWKFFFDTGFVYPKKYAYISTNKEKFKDIYKKLYIQNPNIARHFIYQDKGTIQGHISMLRAYENTWLFHHLASRATYAKAGLVVLDQISRYAYDFYRLYSTHLDFIISYFRPENRAPDHLFGNFTRQLNESKGSSIDPFAYFHFQKIFESLKINETDLSLAKIQQIQPDDLVELQNFYEYQSGGLMLHALNLDPGTIDEDNLDEEYRKAGFKRERHLFSLKKKEVLEAVIMVNISDAALNLSNLTNCIHIFCMDKGSLDRSMYALSCLACFIQIL
ncbi:MAG: PilZ domain-containing protein [Epsilonproteobacteria bacterium]|nr:PilZ domain-containing protein [Campylobacterota bacterium]